MIQRIQSIFLLLIAVSMGAFLGLPLWGKASANESVGLTALQLAHQQGKTTYITPVYYLAILAVLIAVVAIFALFKYRNRLFQMGLCAVNAILLTVTMGLVLYITLYKAKAFFAPTDQGQYSYGFYALVAALLFNMFANRFIRRDEKLVQESNRIR